MIILRKRTQWTSINCVDPKSMMTMTTSLQVFANISAITMLMLMLDHSFLLSGDNQTPANGCCSWTDWVLVEILTTTIFIKICNLYKKEASRNINHHNWSAIFIKKDVWSTLEVEVLHRNMMIYKCDGLSSSIVEKLSRIFIRKNIYRGLSS